MQKRIYIETTIPSSFYTLRTEAPHKMVTREDLLRPEMNEVVKEVREIRFRISEKYGHDINRLLAHYQDPEPPAEKSTSTESPEDKVAD